MNACVFEGEHSGTQLTAVDTYTGDGPALPRDNPFRDHLDGTLTGPEVCDWLAILDGAASNINGANICYRGFGPNSNSALRYMLGSLPDQTWYHMPWMIGWGSLLPGIEK